jgi:4-hydroxyphenylpyruvate dioxygenase
MGDLPIQHVDHVEFYVGNAKQAALFYSKCFGFTNTAYRGLETGERDVASYVMEQGNIRFVVSSGLYPDHRISKLAWDHGDHVAVIALSVPDAEKAHAEATSRGALEAIPPTTIQDDHGMLGYSAIHIYGNVLLKFVDRSSYAGVFAPGFEPCMSCKQEDGSGLRAIDHVVANVELGNMERWVKFFADTMGFEILVHFDEQAISTEYSALASKVMQDKTGTIKFPINEPAPGKRKSQIEEYLDYNGGPGVQHIALATDNIIETVSRLKAAGLQFLQVPATYYQNLTERVEPITVAVEKLAELGILVDRDSDGYLLQIFTQTVQDRPTLFFEVIQRCGAQGFGEGNFKALFEAIEREQAVRGNL